MTDEEKFLFLQLSEEQLLHIAWSQSEYPALREYTMIDLAGIMGFFGEQWRSKTSSSNGEKKMAS